jgi:CBS domain-containing protein/sporulation protein YlmC with PRC-barrel domain
MATMIANGTRAGGPGGEFTFHFFSELFRRRIRTTTGKRVGRLDDIVFAMKEPYPEAVGIVVEHGLTEDAELIPWHHVVRIGPTVIEVTPSDTGDRFPRFVDEPGWVLIDKHLMGRTVLDIDGRRIEAVNDVHLLESHGRMVIAHVDTSFNGFLRKWHLGGLHLVKDNLISWKYVQPLSVEDAIATDSVQLSLEREQLPELPAEDLADALEELSGEEQQALFGALDSEKAAETLIESEPRTQRQLIADLRREQAGEILSELSVPQLAALFSVLPHDQRTELLSTLSPEDAARVQAILGEREVTAGALVSDEWVGMPPERRVGEALAELRRPGREPQQISYVYVVDEKTGVVQGVVDLRELVLSRDDATLEEIMAAPVVAVEADDLQDDVHRLFAKYHFRMVPVVDRQDRILGVIQDEDVIKGLQQG